MKSARTLLFSLVCFASCHSWANDGNCYEYPRLFGSYWDGQVCQCGSAISKVKATVPVGTKLQAVCSLRWPLVGPIDLEKAAVSLDETDPSGNYPQGDLYLDGEIVVSGSVRIEPGNAGDVWFDVQSKHTTRTTEFTKEFATFKFIGKNAYTIFRVPEENRRTACSTANATIRARRFHVVIEDTDRGGTYPLDVQVLSMSSFKKCPGQ